MQGFGRFPVATMTAGQSQPQNSVLGPATAGSDSYPRLQSATDEQGRQASEPKKSPSLALHAASFGIVDTTPDVTRGCWK